MSRPRILNVRVLDNTLPCSGGDAIFYSQNVKSSNHDVVQTYNNATSVTMYDLQGKAPAILCDDFPLRLAAERILFAKLMNAGQICTTVDHAYVPRAKAERSKARRKGVSASTKADDAKAAGDDEKTKP